MKFVRYLQNGITRSGILTGEVVEEIQGDIFSEFTRSDRRSFLTEVTLIEPLKVNNIIGLSNVNYYAAMKQRGVPHPDQILWFLKPRNTLIGPNESIGLPSYVQNAAHEIELTIVIGKQGKFIPVQEAAQYIFGYTLANDITARDFLVPNFPIGKAKSFDTFTPLGPCIETDVDLSTLNYKLSVSGELRQDVYASDFIFTPDQIVSELSQFMTLSPGDIILTGAPYNSLEFEIGDTIDMECEQIGKMTHQVKGI
ncbi:MAG: 5-carboxymethyl-2-hydroxymuconate Delta-isomerase [Bacilli bacterium]|nr:5-carboxymethyl-2-hydroxymuconate Delta-isomerase [Bacilli bacterium]